MNLSLLLIALTICQDSSVAQAAPQEAELRMMDVRIHMIGLKTDFELPDVVADPESFLKDPRTIENRLWSRDFRMSTVLGRDLTMALGENSPMVTGVTTTPGGRSPNLTFQQTGTMLRVKSSLDSKDRILLNLAVENSRIDRGDDTNGELEKEMLKTSIRNLMFESEIVVSSGKTKAISYSQSSSDPEAHSEKAMLLITATILPD